MKLDKIDLNLLVVLDAVLTTKSVSKAAAIVGLSKPAASHALSRIRAQVNDQIIVRSGQSWILTERASAMAQRVKNALLEARGVLSPERAFEARSLRREFRIHASDQMLSLLGLALGHAVSQEAPQVGLRFLPLQADEAAALRGNVDLALGVFHDLPADLRTQRLFDDRFVCVVREGHPATGEKLSLDQYLSLRHVVVAPLGTPGSVIDDALAKRKLVRRAVRWVPYYSSALEFVAESDCVATLSEQLAEHHAERYGLRLLRLPFQVPPCAGTQIWHARLDADPAHAWLRRKVVAAAGEARARRRRSARVSVGPT